MGRDYIKASTGPLLRAKNLYFSKTLREAIYALCNPSKIGNEKPEVFKRARWVRAQDLVSFPGIRT
jgi:hypothetical protein